MTSTRLGEGATASFARHETFPPRFGWLHKAYEAIEERRQADVFILRDAPIQLGVGKNMVNAIRYWSAAFRLTVEHPRGGASRAFTASATWEACWLLSENGADPYLEDPASLWVLHWWLLSPECMAPTWWVAFHAFPSMRFTEEELAAAVTQHVKLAGWNPPAPASIAKDVDCLSKMYAPRKTPTGSPGSFEDLLDCPFRELGLLEAVPDASRTWRFTDSARAMLPSRIVAYACLDYASRARQNKGSISLARLAHEPGAPGLAFRLTEPMLVTALEEVRSCHGSIEVSEAAGQRSLVYDRDPELLASLVLDAHYGNARNRVPSRHEWLDDHPALAAELERRRRATQPTLPRTEDVA